MLKTTSTLTPAIPVCTGLGINRRTLDRWLKDPNLGMPEPIVINGRLYFEDDKIEAWKRQRATVSRKTAKRPPAVEPRQSAA